MSSPIAQLQSLMEPLARKWRLAVRGRRKLSCSTFRDHERLYRGFRIKDLDAQERLDIELFESSDISVNWSRFSTPLDVRYRVGGRISDGSFSFTVADANSDKVAIACHDPLAGNYSHTEIRWLKEGEDVEPPHGRKNSSSKTAKAIRMKWRVKIIESATIEVRASNEE